MMAHDPKIPIIRLYRGVIELVTPLFIGMGNPQGLEGVSRCRRDGAGAAVIPGSTLAGLFFEDMEWLFQADQCLMPQNWLGLSGKLTSQKRLSDKGRSALSFATSVMLGENMFTIRDRIRLDPATRTVADKAKFAQEQVAAGALFTFELEIEGLFLASEMKKPLKKTMTQRRLLIWIEKVLTKWITEGFFIGGSSGAGNGWARLCELEKWDVTQASYRDYLNRQDKDHYHAVSPSHVSARDLSIPFTLCLDGLEENTNGEGYGLDFLEIHQGDYEFFPDDQDAPFYSEKYLDEYGNVIHRYIISGATLRGVMRAFLSAYYPASYIDLWFGKAALRGEGWRGLIRMRDATGPCLDPGTQPFVVWSHTEDEFIGATFEGNLFNHSPLMRGTFHGELRYPNIYQRIDHTESDVWFTWAFRMLHLEEAGLSLKNTWIRDALSALPEAINFFFEHAAQHHVSVGGGGGRPRWEKHL